MTKKKKIFLNIVIITIGLIGLWLVTSHIAHFEFPEYFYNANPDIKTYVGTNVVSAWADFSFFTYQTLIIFSIWCILFGIANIFSLQKLNDFLRRDTVISFVFVNYFFTVLLYTIFELSSGNITFGLYANTPLGFHNLATNLIIHYVYFAICLTVFIKLKTSTSSTKRAGILVFTYLLFYYTIVKILGEFAYNIRWFPYIIFDAKTFGNTFGITNYLASIVVLIITCVVIFSAYILSYFGAIKLKRKQQSANMTQN